MKNGWQNLFLVIFALLQCVAPLAHAHVDGMDAAPNVYSHELSPSHTHEAHLENQLGAVVALTQAAPFSDPLVLDEPCISSSLMCCAVTPVALPVMAMTQLNQVLFRSHRSYALAHPQAPPQQTL
ncbi:MAG: hypothetical protein ACXW1C_02840 [Gallionella sp.]